MNILAKVLGLIIKIQIPLNIVINALKKEIPVYQNKGIGEDYDTGAGVNYNENYYTELTFDGNPKKTCYFDNDNICQTKYYACEAYTEKDEATCENIILYNEDDYRNYSLKWEYENEKCVTKPRKCEEYDTIPNYSRLGVEFICDRIQPTDKSKRCFYYDNKCIEIPKKCEDYKENSKDICEKIIIYDSNDKIDYSHQCVYEDETCKTERIKCS